MLVNKPKTPTPAASVKDGTYPAAVTGIKQFVNTHGEGVGFAFTILSGPFKGEKVLRSTARQLTRQSKLAEVIEGITGRELTDKELQAALILMRCWTRLATSWCCKPEARPARPTPMSSGFFRADHPLRVTKPQHQPKGQQCQRSQG